ncbi:CPBP family intramembrane metalloprotease [Pseudomaricurvus alkylphenolicus]|uniref:CPBP family intramembrane glutamic endopeptidase n=1 Tax=Pseudomaricurvus alkylphenolicus TaxID=1306991 RepID=UPI001422B4F7|nr:CPBP family intramembrane glutamic endopeptidase [Pseudomaricurvus alkylphenolicus]NIB42445.1 CPBP family intramembrane metalloprotease [Pseudomaricurvus alkylphenolicus]
MNIVQDSQVTKRELIVFFLLTFSVSTAAVFLSGPMIEQGVGDQIAASWYKEKALIIIWIPMLSALVTALCFRGKQGLSTILKRLLVWKVGYRWWAVALLLPIAMVVIPAMLQGKLITTNIGELIFIFIQNFMFIGVIMIGEELGWRGYALPALQAHFTPLKASLLLGFLWGVWHYPVWYGRAFGGDGSTEAIIIMLAGSTLMTLALALIFTWLANHTQAAILIAMVMHGANNASLRLLNEEFNFGVWVMVLMVVAAVIVVLNRNMFISKPEGFQVTSQALG